MVFIALKPCRFGGMDYKIGDSIPQEKVLPERVEALHQMGIITVGLEEIANRLNESVRDTAGDSSEGQQMNGGNTEPDEDRDEEQPKQRGRRKAE